LIAALGNYVIVDSDEEKAPVKVSGGDQEDERKRTADDVSKLFR